MRLRTTPRSTPRARRTKHSTAHSTTTTTTRPAHTHAGTTTTSVTKPTLMGRLRGQRTVVHQKHHATLGDKISGAMLKLKGKLTRRPGEVAAGTRRMRGTDGRGARRRAHRV